jgi:hypothetical protein
MLPLAALATYETDYDEPVVVEPVVDEAVIDDDLVVDDLIVVDEPVIDDSVIDDLIVDDLNIDLDGFGFGFGFGGNDGFDLPGDDWAYEACCDGIDLCLACEAYELGYCVNNYILGIAIPAGECGCEYAGFIALRDNTPDITMTVERDTGNQHRYRFVFVMLHDGERLTTTIEGAIQGRPNHISGNNLARSMRFDCVPYDPATYVLTDFFCGAKQGQSYRCPTCENQDSWQNGDIVEKVYVYFDGNLVTEVFPEDFQHRQSTPRGAIENEGTVNSDGVIINNSGTRGFWYT